jgi:hypothetical protein
MNEKQKPAPSLADISAIAIETIEFVKEKLAPYDYHPVHILDLALKILSLR